METEATELEVRYFLAKYAANTAKSLLDVGCGDGLVVGRNLTGADYEHILYTGLDSYYWDDPERDIHLKDSARRRFVYGDALAMPFPDNTFDLVVATHVLEHIADLDTALSEMRRVLKPSGKVLVVVPLEGGSFGNWLNRHRNVHKDIRKLFSRLGIWNYNLVSPHVQFMGYDGWKQRLAKGFCIDGSYPRGTWLMLVFLVAHYTLQTILRQRFDLSDYVKRNHAGLYSQVVRRNGGLALDGAYILSKRQNRG